MITGLPSGWQEFTVADLLSALPNKALLSHGWSPQCEKEASDDPTIWSVLKTTAVQAGRFEPQHNKRLPAKLKPRPQFEVQPGDLLITCAGPRARCGVPCLVRTTRTRLMLSGKMYRFRPRADRVLPEYLEGLLLSPVAQAAIDRIKTGISDSGLNLTYDRFLTLRFPIAPLEEQHAIVSEIEKHFTRLDAAESAVATSKAKFRTYRASLLRDAMGGRLPLKGPCVSIPGPDGSQRLDSLLRWRKAANSPGRPPVPPDLTGCSELPGGWCWASVDQVGDVLLGRQRAPQFLLGRSPKPYLRVANVKDDFIDTSDVESMDFDAAHFAKYQLEPGDILVSEGQSPELVGQSAICRGGIDGLCFQKTLHRFRAVSGGPTAEFAQLVFRAHVMNGIFMRRASITTNIAHLTLEKFKATPFPLPPEHVENAITAKVLSLLSIASATERAASDTRRRSQVLRGAILRAAFSGELLANGTLVV